MKVQLGPDVYECILHRVVEPLCGIGVDILKVVINKGFIVITMTNSERVTIDSTTFEILKTTVRQSLEREQ